MITCVQADLAIIIVTYNSAHVIGDLSIPCRRRWTGCTADVVVVDNGSADGTADLAGGPR